VTTPCMTAPDRSLPPSRLNSWSHDHQCSKCSPCSIDDQSSPGVTLKSNPPRYSITGGVGTFSRYDSTTPIPPGITAGENPTSRIAGCSCGKHLDKGTWRHRPPRCRRGGRGRDSHRCRHRLPQGAGDVARHVPRDADNQVAKRAWRPRRAAGSATLGRRGRSRTFDLDGRGTRQRRCCDHQMRRYVAPTATGHVVAHRSEKAMRGFAPEGHRTQSPTGD
jgi:hypothetical protein